LAKQLEKINKKYVSFIDSNNDLDEILKKLKKIDFDSIILIANSLDSVKIIQYLRSHNINVAFLVSSWALAGNFMKNIGHFSNNIYFPVVKDKLIDKKEYDKFYNKFMRVYNKEPKKFNNDGYVVGKILIEALKNVGYSPNKVKKYILSHKFKVNGAVYEFNKFGDLKEKYHILAIKNQKLVEVE